MSLPACQERVLRGIENALRRGEPRLASRFAIFTRLTRDEELPRTEQLVQRPWPWRWLDRVGVRSRRRRRGAGAAALASGRPATRLRAMVLVPVLLIMTASGLAFASTSGSHTCPAASNRVAVAARWMTCTASEKPTHAARPTGHGPHHGR
ncbi:MAG TPA: hypothetical protein VKD66_04930 [Streptosporangiaceae bacterium]|nr:hypothetical protein [Streptosporangiaceae bacterium]